MLDDLVKAIETVKDRIANHGASLRENEIRTRNALIDPLLTALGWDVADPALVTPEYNVRGRKADYALRTQESSPPAATIEAKRLGQHSEIHRGQMLSYANEAGIRFAGLTDGDIWEVYEVFKAGQLEERRVLNVAISATPTHEAALKLLLLWRPNLASGQPVAANEPALVGFLPQPQPEAAPAPQPQPSAPASAGVASAARSTPIPSPAPEATPSPAEGWRTLKDIQFQKGDSAPIEIWFSSGERKHISSWVDVWAETCQWLAANGRLNRESYYHPGSTAIHLVNKTGIHPNGSNFKGTRRASGGFQINCNLGPPKVLHSSQFMLQETGMAPDAVQVRFAPQAVRTAQANATTVIPPNLAHRETNSPTSDIAGDWVSLDSIVNPTGMARPTAIRVSNGSVTQVNAWAGILTATAEWLVAAGHLSAATVPRGRSFNFISPNPTKQDEKEFLLRKGVSGGLFVETHLSSKAAVAYTQRILSHFGVDPATVDLLFA